MVIDCFIQSSLEKEIFLSANDVVTHRNKRFAAALMPAMKVAANSLFKFIIQSLGKALGCNYATLCK